MPSKYTSNRSIRILLNERSRRHIMEDLRIVHLYHHIIRLPLPRRILRINRIRRIRNTLPTSRAPDSTRNQHHLDHLLFIPHRPLNPRCQVLRHHIYMVSLVLHRRQRIMQNHPYL